MNARRFLVVARKPPAMPGVTVKKQVSAEINRYNIISEIIR